MGRLVLLALVLVLVGGAPAMSQQDSPEPPLPQPRPDTLGESADQDPSRGDEPVRQGTDRIYQSACPALLSGRIVGQMQPRLAEGQCGLQSPIAISAVTANGRQIALPGVPVANCAMATTLAEWA